MAASLAWTRDKLQMMNMDLQTAGMMHAALPAGMNNHCIPLPCCQDIQAATLIFICALSKCSSQIAQRMSYDMQADLQMWSKVHLSISLSNIRGKP